MKRVILSVLFVLAVTVIFSGFVKAEEQKKIEYYGSFGGMFPYLPTIGVNADYRISYKTTLSPEVNVIFYYYIPALIAPGAQLNYNVSKSFRIGAGVSFYTTILGLDNSRIVPLLKFNTGYIKNRWKYEFYVLMRPGSLEDDYFTSYGVSISFRL